jgi:antitoxin FitA
MGVLIQVRDVPEEVHRVLKARAAEEGMSLSEFVRRELARVATRPTQAELLRRIKSLPPMNLGEGTGADLVREAREEYDP